MKQRFEGHLHINEELAFPLLPVKNLKHAAMEEWESDYTLGWLVRASSSPYFPRGDH